jgi:hypothetical protein
MSADNGLVLWHDGERYVVSYYSGSSEPVANADLRRLGDSETLAEAVRIAQDNQSGIEYGLTLELDEALLAAETARAQPSAPAPERVEPAGPRHRPSPLAAEED